MSETAQLNRNRTCSAWPDKVNNFIRPDTTIFALKARIEKQEEEGAAARAAARTSSMAFTSGTPAAPAH